MRPTVGGPRYVLQEIRVRASLENENRKKESRADESLRCASHSSSQTSGLGENGTGRTTKHSTAYNCNSIDVILRGTLKISSFRSAACVNEIPYEQ
jgi:hypothetical protein